MIIPFGSLVRIVCWVRPGGTSRSGRSSFDQAQLTTAASGLIYLRLSCTVYDGPFAGRRFVERVIVAGADGASEPRSKALLRAIMNSSRNLQPADISELAREARRLSAWQCLDSQQFGCEVKIARAAAGSRFEDSNAIARVIEPGHVAYNQLMLGIAEPPQRPAWAKPAPHAVDAAALPAWADDALQRKLNVATAALR